MPIGFPLACDAIAGVTIHCAESPCAAQSFPGLLRDLATVATCMEGCAGSANSMGAGQAPESSLWQKLHPLSIDFSCLAHQRTIGIAGIST